MTKCSIGIGLFGCALLGAGGSGVAAADFAITMGKLGVSNGQYVVAEEIREIPACEAPDWFFGFTVSRSPPGRFSAHAEYVLPAEPAVLSGNLSDETPAGYAAGIPGDERVLETRGVWRITFDEGDPLGTRGARIVIDGKVVEVLEYKLVPCNVISVD